MFDHSLNNALDIRNLSSINELIVRMDSLVTLLDADSDTRGFIPFTRTYTHVTKAVSDDQGEFIDFDAIEELDLVFANEYFSKLRLYLNGVVSQPWRTYLNYSAKEKSIPFVSMFLGISSHINGDLAVSLDKSSTQNREDFDRVNQILKEVTPKVMLDLFREDGDLSGLAADVFMPFVENEIDKIIVTWRDNAWEVSEQLKRKNIFTKRSAVKKIYEQADAVNVEILDIFNIDSLSDGLEFLGRLHSLRLPVLD